MRVEVDVDLSNFDLDDLINELEDRLEYKNNKKDILDFCRESLNMLSTIPTDTLLDTIKIEVIEQNLHKFTLDELETFFKSK